MAQVTEIAPDVFRISIYVPPFDLQFNQFLIRDDEPVLHHAGMTGMFPEFKEAVSKLIDVSKLRWISISHFEVDECGSLNKWLELAKDAQAVCSVVGAIVNLNDFSIRPPRGLEEGEMLNTGKYRFRFIPTPHLPHGWDAGMLFEETHKTLFCSDLVHQVGEVAPIVDSEDVLDRSRTALLDYQKSPLMNYVPYTVNTKMLMEKLIKLDPKTLAIMHGSTFSGNGARVLSGFELILKEIYGTA